MQLEVPSGVLCCGNIQILLWALVLLYHHIVSIALLSRNHLSWKGSLKVVWSSSPVRSGVSYNPIRLLRAWSSLKYQSLFHLRFKQSNYKNPTAYKLSHPSPQLRPERPQSVNNPCSPHLMNSCVSELAVVVVCFLDGALVFPSPCLESAAAEKQNCAFLLILSDNHADRILLQVSVNADFYSEVLSCMESLSVAERKWLCKQTPGGIRWLNV